MSQLPFPKKGWWAIEVGDGDGAPGKEMFLKEKESLLYPQLPSRWYLERHRPLKAACGLAIGSVCSPTSWQMP